MELIPRLHDTMQVISSNLGPWRHVSMLDWSLENSKGGILMISMQEKWNIGEGRTFDERTRKNAAAALTHVRENYKMLEVKIPMKNFEGKVTFSSWAAFVDPDYETKLFIRSLDCFLAYVAPDFTGKKEIEWFLPQLKIEGSVKRGHQMEKVKTIGEVFRKYEMRDTDTTIWEIEYFGSEKEDSEDEWIRKKADLKYVQRRWTDTIESGKLKEMAPQNAKILDNNRSAVIIEYWKELKELDKLPSASVQICMIDILTVEILKETASMIRQDSNYFEVDDRMEENLTMALAIKLLEKLDIPQLRGKTIDQVARKLAETGDNLFSTTPDNFMAEIRRFKKIANLETSDNFWYELGLLTRRALQITYDWITQIIEDGTLPTQMLMWPEPWKFLEGFGNENLVEKDIPSVFKANNIRPQEIILAPSEPIRLIAISLMDNIEEIKTQRDSWQLIVENEKTSERARAIFTELDKSIEKENEMRIRAAWNAAKNMIEEWPKIGHVRIAEKENVKGAKGKAMENIQVIFQKFAAKDAEQAVRMWDNVIGEHSIQLWIMKDMDIQKIPIESRTSKDITSKILNAVGIQIFGDYHCFGTCAVDGCKRKSGDHPVCHVHMHSLPLIFGHSFYTRMVTDVTGKYRKILAKDRMKKTRILEDWHPKNRAGIYGDILEVHTENDENIDGKTMISALCLETIKNGTDVEWSTKGLLENKEISEKMKTFDKEYWRLEKKARWTNVEKQKKGRVIMFRLLEITDGKRQYKEPIMMKIEDGETRWKSMTDYESTKDTEWIQFRRSLGIKMSELSAKVKEKGQFLADGQTWPEIILLNELASEHPRFHFVVACADYKIRQQWRRMIKIIDQREFRTSKNVSTKVTLLTDQTIGGFRTIEKDCGVTREVVTALMPIRKRERSWDWYMAPRAEEDYQISKFLTHFIVQENYLLQLHPENLISISTWNPQSSKEGVRKEYKDRMIWMMALWIDLSDKRRLKYWIIEGGEPIYKDKARSGRRPPDSLVNLLKEGHGKDEFYRLAREMKTHRSMIEAWIMDDMLTKARWYIGTIDIGYVMKIYMRVDPRFNERLLVELWDVWRKFVSTGKYLGEKEEIMETMEEAFIKRTESAEYQNDRRMIWRRLPFQNAYKYQTIFPNEDDNDSSSNGRRPDEDDDEDSSDDDTDGGTSFQEISENIVYEGSVREQTDEEGDPELENEENENECPDGEEEDESTIPELETNSEEEDISSDESALTTSDESEDSADGKDYFEKRRQSQAQENPINALEEPRTREQVREEEHIREMEQKMKKLSLKDKIDGASRTEYESRKSELKKEIKEDKNRMSKEEKKELESFKEKEIEVDQKIENSKIKKKPIPKGKYKDEFKNKFPENLERRSDKALDNEKASKEMIKRNTENGEEGYEIFQQTRSQRAVNFNDRQLEEAAENLETRTYTDWSDSSEMCTEEEIALSRENSQTDLPRIPEVKRKRHGEFKEKTAGNVRRIERDERESEAEGPTRRAIRQMERIGITRPAMIIDNVEINFTEDEQQEISVAAYQYSMFEGTRNNRDSDKAAWKILEYLLKDSAQTTEIIGRVAEGDGQFNRSAIRVMIMRLLKLTGRLGTITRWSRKLYPDGNDGLF